MAETYKVREPSGSERIRAIVTDVTVSTAGEVFREAAKKPEQRVLVVRFEGSENGYSVQSDRAMTLIEPPTKKSNLLRWKKTYGEYPEIGQEIELRFDSEKRRWEPVLN